MRKAVLALLGLAIGYRWGYDDASQRKPSIARRALDKFGATRIKNAQENRERQTDAIRP
jgi:hypothetical protein